MNKHYKKHTFQGDIKRSKNYFEGWYYKQVSQEALTSISFIPGVSMNEEDPHAFIQCIYNHGGKLKTLYFKFALSDFTYNHEPFEVSIAGNVFTLKDLVINLEDESHIISGQLNYSNLLELEKSIVVPNIMGPLSYIKNLECNHDILSMDHEVNGEIILDDEVINFNCGRGYIEKDWGRSFPDKYLWVQSNHFSRKKTSICCSIAKLPILNMTIQGFFCNITHLGKEYRFATYNGGKIKRFIVNNNRYEIHIFHRSNKLILNGDMSLGQSLVAPSHGKMSYTIKEGLTGRLHMKLIDRRGNVIIDETSDHCGIEIVGY